MEIKQIVDFVVCVVLPFLVVPISLSVFFGWAMRTKNINVKRSVMIESYLYTLACAVIDPLILERYRHTFDMPGLLMFLGLGVYAPAVAFFNSLKLAIMMGPTVEIRNTTIYHMRSARWFPAAVVFSIIAFLCLGGLVFSYLSLRSGILVGILVFAPFILRSAVKAEQA